MAEILDLVAYRKKIEEKRRREEEEEIDALKAELEEYLKEYESFCEDPVIICYNVYDSEESPLSTWGTDHGSSYYLVIDPRYFLNHDLDD